MEAQCSSRDEAERRRRSKLRAEDEKMHSLAQQGRQSLIIVSDPLAPSAYTGRKLSPGVSSGGFSDGSSSPPPPRAPLLKRLSRRMSDSLAHITQHAEPHSEFFDLDDSYIDARTVEHEAVLRGHYPARGSPWAALDPSAPWRTWWDAWMLALVVYVMFVTPFELAFVNKVPLDGGLFVANCVADLSFLGDLVLQFHTGYYDTWRREWVTSRRRIAAHYASCYLWLDVVSLLPYEYLYRKSSGLAILRLVRLVRLAKLLRVAKAPRILANIPLFAEMSFKAHVVAKYLGCLVGMLHLQACSIRLAHDFHRGGGDNAGTNSYLVWKALTFRHTSWPSNWASYVDSLDWAVQTMLGQSAYMTTAEGVLSIASNRAGKACDIPKGSDLGRVSNLVGIMFVAFLFGDLTNILCNLDPASNEFKRTVDNMNKFASDNNFPRPVRDQLRDYLRQSESLFRAKFHGNLVDKLSPNLQELIAHFRLGHRVVTTPLVSYARQCTLGLVVGRRLVIRPRRRPRPRKKPRGGDDDDASAFDRVRREAVITRICPGMNYDVRYLDDFSAERSVAHDRISLRDESTRVQRAVQTMEYVTKLLVTNMAKTLVATLFMGGDYVIRKDITLTSAMYVVDGGRVMVFGRDVLRPYAMSFLTEGGCFGDQTAAMIVAGHAPRPAWYNARATMISRLLVLEADALFDIISKPGFETFRKYIARYGVWASFKINFVKAMKNGDLARVLTDWHREEAPAADLARAESFDRGFEDRVAPRRSSSWPASDAPPAGEQQSPGVSGLRASYDYMSHPHHDSFDELATLAEQHDGKP
ncbi:voltage-gated potassium channel [Aureococcus anophagefferens]|uniref:Voltage-gated potassium channel n=1 Tax=Aureococcus anophagefferens TaxID=44056 RepID=A0ABR1G368_AURAN